MKPEEHSPSKTRSVDEVNWGGQIADLKGKGYRLEVLLNAVVDCLEKKELLTRDEVLKTAGEMDRLFLLQALDLTRDRDEYTL